MGILLKAIRKAQAGAERPAPGEDQRQPPAAPPKPLPRPAGSPPPPAAAPAAVPETPRKVSGRPAPRPQAPAAKPSEVPPPSVASLEPALSAPGAPGERTPPSETRPHPVSALATALALNRGAEPSGPPPVSPEDAAQTAPPAPAPQAAAEPPAAARPAAGGVAPDLVSLVNPEGPEAELFKLLRTRILFPQSGHPPRTILVTSALAEEGKSFVASNLAVNIAKNVDEHVLLVDCDLRKPSIHSRFGFNGIKGLSEYLAAGLGLSGLLVKTGVEKLTLLPSGASPSNPSELISSSRMAGLIEELKARYDDRYIILDSPPPLMAPETSAIAKWADGILVVVRFGTPMSLVEELIAHLDREKIIGVVINQVHQREFRRYSYKKYYRNSRYYPA